MSYCPRCNLLDDMSSHPPCLIKGDRVEFARDHIYKPTRDWNHYFLGPAKGDTGTITSRLTDFVYVELDQPILRPSQTKWGVDSVVVKYFVPAWDLKHECPEYHGGHHFNSDNTCACGLDTYGTQHPAETCVDCGARCGVQPLAGCVDAVGWEDGARCLDCSYKKCGEQDE